MSRILLTGATGFIGRHCIQPLVDRGWEVVAVTSRPIADLPERPGVLWRQADLLDPAAPAPLLAETRPDALLHLAWRLVAGSVENYRWTRASLQLLMEFAESGGRRAVFAGSCAEYDWHGPQPLSEDSARRPATPYGLCKNALGELFEGYRREVGLSAAWARIFFVYGPGEAATRLVPSVVRALLAGQPAETTHGKQLRDYLYVGDLAEALATLVDGDLAGAINIASGRSVALGEIVREIARQMSREDLPRFGAIAAHPEEAAEVTADVSRLHDAVDWRPRVELGEGLERTIAWWRTQAEGMDA